MPKFALALTFIAFACTPELEEDNVLEVRSASALTPSEARDRTVGCRKLEELDVTEIADLCEAIPYGRPLLCVSGGPTTEACSLRMDMFARCGLTTCEYDACAMALAEAPCDEMPAACAAVMQCFDESAC